MAGPFAVFRRNQRFGMALILVMCMISFVFLGTTGLFDNKGNVDAVMATTKFGPIRESEIDAFAQRGGVANRFLHQVVLLSIEALRRENKLGAAAQYNDAVLANGLEQQLRTSGMISDIGTPEAIVQEILWEKKADELGIVVTDSGVNDFLQKLTQEVVPAGDILGAMAQIRADERYVFSALTHRLRAVRARDLIEGGLAQATPGSRLDWFRRKDVEAVIEFMPIEVTSYITEVPDPGETQLVAFFERHKRTTARRGSAEPGFNQPARATFRYFHASLDDFSKPDEVTAEEIQAFYDKNKEFFPVDAPSAPVEEAPSTPGVDATSDETSSESPAATDAAPPPSTEVPPADAAPDAEQPSDAPAETPSTEPNAEDGTTAPAAPSKPEASLDGSAQDAPPAEDSKPADAPPEDAQPAEAQPASDEKPEPAPEGETPVAGEQPTEEMFSTPKQPEKYKSLEETAPLIRESLATDKARVRLESVLNELASQLRAHETDKARALSNNSPAPKPLDMAALAKERGLKFGETKSIAADDLYETTELGKAVVPGQAMVAVYAFDNLPLNQAVQADGGVQQFLFWKTEQRTAHEPKFAEVRAQVLDTWKQVEARKLAEAEARVLAESARKSGRALADAYENRPGAVIKAAGPFKWLVPMAADPLSPQNVRYRLSDVEGVDAAGQEFMRSVFSLGVGDIGVAWNEPQSTVYVVRMQRLAPEDMILWERFAAATPQSYTFVGQNDLQEVANSFSKDLQEQAGLVWHDASDEDLVQ